MFDRGRCYCDTISDANRRRARIPAGYCALCSMCGQPGYGRHSPVPVPGSEELCDACFDRFAQDYDAWRERNPAGFTAPFANEWRERHRVRPNNALHRTDTAASTGESSQVGYSAVSAGELGRGAVAICISKRHEQG